MIAKIINRQLIKKIVRDKLTHTEIFTLIKQGAVLLRGRLSGLSRLPERILSSVQYVRNFSLVN